MLGVCVGVWGEEGEDAGGGGEVEGEEPEGGAGGADEGGEPVKGEGAAGGGVGVIMNRVRSGRFGRSACEIVYARGQFVGIENMMKADEKNIDKETLLKTKLL